MRTCDPGGSSAAAAMSRPASRDRGVRVRRLGVNRGGSLRDSPPRQWLRASSTASSDRPRNRPGTNGVPPRGLPVSASTRSPPLANLSPSAAAPVWAQFSSATRRLAASPSASRSMTSRLVGADQRASQGSTARLTIQRRCRSDDRTHFDRPHASLSRDEVAERLQQAIAASIRLEDEHRLVGRGSRSSMPATSDGLDRTIAGNPLGGVKE